MASEGNTVEEPVELFLLGRAGVVFFELEVGGSSFVCVHWVGSGEERVKKRWKEIGLFQGEKTNSMENGNSGNSKSLICPD